ncbi:hypothetical protein [Vibrio sp. NH-UV-68]|uniref:hypothetical protein n=1 Tax=unclassified Vibrio TaxID=2614977 RepID=UPI0036F444EF
MDLLNYFPYIGLALDIVGAGLLWKYGITATIDHPEFNAVMEEAWVSGSNNYEQIVRDSKKQIRIVKRWSKLGLFLLILGFAMQIVGSVSSSLTIDTLRQENSALVDKVKVYDSKLGNLASQQLAAERSVSQLEATNLERYESILIIYNQQQEELSDLRSRLQEPKETREH